jgi:hypothetical protein
VALGYLLVVPIMVSICGTVFVFVSLARSTRKATRSASVYRVARLAAVAGLGLALGYGMAGILSQVPDSLAGLNGPFIRSTTPAIQVFVLGGIELSMSLLIGAMAARVWWEFRGPHLPPRSRPRVDSSSALEEVSLRPTQLRDLKRNAPEWAQTACSAEPYFEHVNKRVIIGATIVLVVTFAGIGISVAVTENNGAPND